MNNFEPIFVPINRRKMILMTIVYAITGLGACLFTYYLGANQTMVSHTVFKVASVVVLSFFAVVAGTFARNIKNQTAGIRITSKGLEDNTTSISYGLIGWKEITAISKGKGSSSKLLLVYVKQPQKIIDKGKNGAVKRLLQQNLMIYKTPIVINFGSLKGDVNELERESNRFLERFGMH